MTFHVFAVRRRKHRALEIAMWPRCASQTLAHIGISPPTTYSLVAPNKCAVEANVLLGRRAWRGMNYCMIQNIIIALTPPISCLDARGVIIAFIPPNVKLRREDYEVGGPRPAMGDSP